MYNELFVTPKQKELDKLKKREEEVLRGAEKPRKVAGVVVIEDGGESFMQEVRGGEKDKAVDTVDVIEIIMNKYNSQVPSKASKTKQSSSVFSQQL